MHQHLTPQLWAIAFGDPEDVAGQQLYACPRCSGARGTLQTWLEAVAQCPQCTAALDVYEPLPEEALHCDECLASYAVFESWLEKLEHFEPHVAPEWVTAPQLYRELMHMPLEEQLIEVRYRLIYQQWGFCQWLLADSAAARLSDPQRCHDRAGLAVAVAERLNEVDYQPRWVAELRAKAHAYLADALRLLGDHTAAEREFERAESWVERGLGQGRAESAVLSLRASLLLDQFRHLEAEALLERVQRSYRQSRQSSEEARVLLKLAMVSQARERPEEAARRVGRALEILDQVDEPVLQDVARQSLVHFWIDGRDIGHAREVFDGMSEPTVHHLRLRKRWLQGDLLRAEGDLQGAARMYDETRVGFLAEGLHYNVALLSLDLAMVAAEQERHDAVRALALDAVALLTRAGAPQKAFAALRLLIDALESKAVTVAFIQRIARKVARLQPAE